MFITEQKHQECASPHETHKEQRTEGLEESALGEPHGQGSLRN